MGYLKDCLTPAFQRTLIGQWLFNFFWLFNWQLNCFFVEKTVNMHFLRLIVRWNSRYRQAILIIRWAVAFDAKAIVRNFWFCIFLFFFIFFFICYVVTVEERGRLKRTLFRWSPLISLYFFILLLFFNLLVVAFSGLVPEQSTLCTHGCNKRDCRQGAWLEF